MATTEKRSSSARASVLPLGWSVSVRKASWADITHYHAFVYGPNGFLRFVGPGKHEYWLTPAEAGKRGAEAAIKFERQNR